MIEPTGAARPAPLFKPNPSAAGVAEPGLPQDQFAGSREAASSRLQRVQNEEPPQPLPRPMTDEEKSDFKSWFPNLDVEAARVSAEATPQYNCISWTTGNTESWDWPPSMFPDEEPRQAFADYYKERGFTPLSAQDAGKTGHDQELVAYWEDPNGPTHGSVCGPSHGERWESKCGQAARIQHARDELVSDVYGSIHGYYLKTGQGAPSMKKLSQEILERLHLKVEARMAVVPETVRKAFDEAYAEWQAYRNSPRVSISSNPADYCKGPGYDKIVGLGPDALPFLMQKMEKGDHFCQYAAEQISKRKRDGFHILGVEPAKTLKPADVRCSEQEKAQQVMVQWLESSW